MRRIFLPLFLSLAFGLSSPASASESLPQWTNAFGMSFSLIPAGKKFICGHIRVAGAGNRVNPKRDGSGEHITLLCLHLHKEIKYQRGWGSDTRRA